VNDDPMSTLDQLRRDTQPPSADALVDDYFELIGLPAKWRAMMAPFVRAAAVGLMRNAVRHIERRAPLPGTPGISGAKQSKTKKASPAIERRSELAESFYNGSKWITWGEATIDDHQGRVDYQTSKRNGLDEDIQRHLDAIAMIKKARVTCLNDLEPVSS
jgi:hypothetical protein